MSVAADMNCLHKIGLGCSFTFKLYCLLLIGSPVAHTEGTRLFVLTFDVCYIHTLYKIQQN